MAQRLLFSGHSTILLYIVQYSKSMYLYLSPHLLKGLQNLVFSPRLFVLPTSIHSFRSASSRHIVVAQLMHYAWFLVEGVFVVALPGGYLILGSCFNELPSEND